MDGIMSVNFNASQTGVFALTAPVSSGVKTTYSGEEFKTLLRRKYSFPPNITVVGNLDLNHCPELIASLPNKFTVEGDLFISDCGLKSVPEGITVKGVVHPFLKDLNCENGIQ
jgi:hypothetical protein